MAQTTPNLGLRVWNQSTDTYNYEELANNFVSIDLHDHSPGNGMPIDGSSIKSGTIGPSQLGANSVSSGNIVDGSIGNPELAPYGVTYDKISQTPGTRIQSGNLDSGSITPDKLISGISPIASTSSTNYTSSLPATGLYDGYIVDFTTDISKYIWRLRYDSTNSNWDFIGGASIFAQTNRSPALTIGQSSFIAANGMSANLPLSGTYIVKYSATGQFPSNPSSATSYSMGIALWIQNASSVASNSGAYATVPQEAKLATVSGSFKFDTSNTTGVNKTVQNSIIRYSGTTDFLIYYDSIEIIPVGNFTKWVA